MTGFVAEGGWLRSVWGVLREQYFQNALQMGTLYVDVSNDTVVVTKPPVEILPMEASGLVAVRDLAHFRQTAERYWGATLYANHLVPTLAPLLPMMSLSTARPPLAVSPTRSNAAALQVVCAPGAANSSSQASPVPSK